jgi:hypothetical protein
MSGALGFAVCAAAAFALVELVGAMALGVTPSQATPFVALFAVSFGGYVFAEVTP